MCDLEWPLMSYFILWKICVFSMLAFIEILITKKKDKSWNHEVTEFFFLKFKRTYVLNKHFYHNKQYHFWILENPILTRNVNYFCIKMLFFLSIINIFIEKMIGSKHLKAISFIFLINETMNYWLFVRNKLDCTHCFHCFFFIRYLYYQKSLEN